MLPSLRRLNNMLMEIKFKSTAPIVNKCGSLGRHSLVLGVGSLAHSRNEDKPLGHHFKPSSLARVYEGSLPKDHQ